MQYLMIQSTSLLAYKVREAAKFTAPQLSAAASDIAAAAVLTAQEEAPADSQPDSPANVPGTPEVIDTDAVAIDERVTTPPAESPALALQDDDAEMT